MSGVEHAYVDTVAPFWLLHSVREWHVYIVYVYVTAL